MNSSKSSCIEIEALLDAYYDGELDALERESVEKHLQACDPCQAKINSIQQVISSLRNLPRLELQKDIAADILIGMPAASHSRVIKPAVWGSLGIAVAAAVLFVVFHQQAPTTVSTIAELPASKPVNINTAAPVLQVQPAAIAVADNSVDSRGPSVGLSQPPLARPGAMKGTPEPGGRRPDGGSMAMGPEATDGSSPTANAQSTGSDNIVEVAALGDSEQDSSITESIGLASDKDGLYALQM